MPLARCAPSPACGGGLGRGEPLELHLRRGRDGRAFLAEVEEGLGVEAERGSEQDRREVLDAGVVFLHGIVEEAPRGRELVLYVGELALQLLEVLIRLEVRIGLRQREDLPQRAG